MNKLEYWSDITRQIHKIKDMETSHIKSCIKMIKRTPGWRQEYLPVFESELMRRNSKLYKVLK